MSNRISLRVPARVRAALTEYITARTASSYLTRVAPELSFADVASYKLAASYEGNDSEMSIRPAMIATKHAVAIGVTVSDLYHAAAMRAAWYEEQEAAEPISELPANPALVWQRVEVDTD